VQFTPDSYQSFIKLQDKLHQNLCRNRTLVAIGTHDLDTIQAPFVYDARPPTQIKFRSLNQTSEMRADDMMEMYLVCTNMFEYDLSRCKACSYLERHTFETLRIDYSTF
jgi:phenylalanyl-tRNA synthetase beta chain